MTGKKAPSPILVNRHVSLDLTAVSTRSEISHSVARGLVNDQTPVRLATWDSDTPTPTSQLVMWLPSLSHLEHSVGPRILWALSADLLLPRASHLSSNLQIHG